MIETKTIELLLFYVLKCKTSAQGLSRKGVKKIEHVSRRKGWVLK